MHTTEIQNIQKILDDANRIVVLQADNPDADSLGSSLALESILSDLGKQVSLYCAVDMPTYLRYMPGWDRVDKMLPNTFDASIIVDASTMTLFDAFTDPNMKGILSGKPCVILDHHAITDNPIPFASTTLNKPECSSTGELIYALAQELNWPVNKSAGEYIMSSILGDTQGLSNELAKPKTYRIMAKLIELGVSRPALEELRREYGKMPEVILRYKAELIRRADIYADGRVATVMIPQDEINQYSPLYNPAPLIQNDLLQTVRIQVAIVFKVYDSGRITAAIRSNHSAAIAGELAAHFGGGGHKFASGFKIENGKPFNELKAECIKKSTELFDSIQKENSGNSTIH